MEQLFNMENFAGKVTTASELPFDMESQRVVVEYERQQRLGEYRSKMSAQAEMSPEHRTVALKLLLHEAHRTDLRTNGKMKLSPFWKNAAKEAIVDCEHEGPQAVQRNLSCMCIFAPQVKSNLRYGENTADRMARILNQQRLLQRLGQQNTLFLSPQQQQQQHDNQRHPLLARENSLWHVRVSYEEEEEEEEEEDGECDEGDGLSSNGSEGSPHGSYTVRADE